MIGVRRGLRPEVPYQVTTPLTRVQLHVHLDGAVRHETIYELSKKKNLSLPGDGSFRALQDYLIVKKGVSLQDFLSRFDVILGPLIGDLKALERVAYEVVEDAAKQGIAYFEARFNPHILMPQNLTAEDSPESKKLVWDVTGALIKGLKQGQLDFKAKGTLVVTCIRGTPNFWFDHTLDLALDKNFHDGWIVGVDIAGMAETADEGHMLTETTETFCTNAMRQGIPRTVHAAESGDAVQVTIALDKLHANRIGHGYRIVNDRKVYDRVRKENVHLETCPWSSYLTAAVCQKQLPHPVVQFFEDGFNVSVNTDDPTVTGTSLDDEFELLRHWGLTESHIVKASFNAARASFLPETEKADLIQELSKQFGSTL